MIQQLRTFFIKPATFFLVFHLFAGHLVTAQPKEKYLDTKLPVDERVDDLVSRMTLKEKVSQLFNQSPAIDRLGVPAYDWWNECLHGVARRKSYRIPAGDRFGGHIRSGFNVSGGRCDQR